MRIFIAGGSGVLGRTVIPLLTAAGHDVTATTRSSARAHVVQQLGANPVIVDALDADAVSEAVVRAHPDAILHLLTDLSTGDSGSNARLRVVGTRNLVAAAHEAGVSRMVAESISWVYAPGTTPAQESEPLDPVDTDPRRTTIAAVTELESAVQSLAEGVVLRFGQLYGPGTWFSRDGRYGLDAGSGRLHATETVTSFIHTADAADALVRALGWSRGVRNIVDDEPAAGHEWAPRFAAALGAQEPAVARSGDIGRPVSNTRARDDGMVLRYFSWREGFSTL